MLSDPDKSTLPAPTDHHVSDMLHPTRFLSREGTISLMFFQNKVESLIIDAWTNTSLTSLSSKVKVVNAVHLDLEERLESQAVQASDRELDQMHELEGPHLELANKKMTTAEADKQGHSCIYLSAGEVRVFRRDNKK